MTEITEILQRKEKVSGRYDRKRKWESTFAAEFTLSIYLDAFLQSAIIEQSENQKKEWRV